MSQMRSMGLALVAAFVGVMACGPQVGVERQSNRDIAATACAHTLDMNEQCNGSEPFEYPADVKAEHQEQCESNPEWDWTDECADRVRAQAECRLSVTSCDGWRVIGDLIDANGDPGPSPCAKETLALRKDVCDVYDENGNEIDHGQERR